MDVPQRPARVWLKWVVPNLALVSAFVTLFYCLFLFQGYRKLFRDSDTGWHIRAGERMISTGALPHADPYSFTVGGRPWFAWEWGADVAMGLAHRAAGLTGVAFLFALAIASTVWLWFELHWVARGDFLIACLMAPAMLSTVNLHWMARPHLFSWILMLVAVVWLERRVAAWKWFALGAVWANVHASFFLAPAMALAYSGSHFARPFVWYMNRSLEFRLGWRYFGAALAAAAGSVVNPYGFELHRHVIAYLSDRDLLGRIAEFQSFNFYSEGAGWILAVLGLSAAGGVLALQQRKLAAFVLTVLFLAMAMRSARALPLAALVLLPLANGAIREALEQAGVRFRSRLSDVLRYSDGLRRIDARWSGLALAPVVAAGTFLLLRLPSVEARTGFPTNEFPVLASAVVERLPASARIMAPDKFGGYLIYRFEGHRKVFFDGRSDLYGREFLERYSRMVQVRPGWKGIFDSFQFTHALLPVNYSLVAALTREGWTEVYADNVATLLEKPR